VDKHSVPESVSESRLYAWWNIGKASVGQYIIFGHEPAFFFLHVCTSLRSVHVLPEYVLTAFLIFAFSMIQIGKRCWGNGLRVVGWDIQSCIFCRL
jgi:hypothetical protein